MMPKKYTGHVHNAKRCTFDWRDCFIAAVHVDGRFKADEPGEIISEHLTELDAVLWLKEKLVRWGAESDAITVVRS